MFLPIHIIIAEVYEQNLNDNIKGECQMTMVVSLVNIKGGATTTLTFHLASLCVARYVL